MSGKFESIFKNMESKVKGIRSLNLNTSDGLPLFSHYSDEFNLDEGKVSAVTSSLTALSHAAAKQLIAAQFESTCIETNNGIMYMVKTKYQGKSCVLSLITGSNPNLGQVRFYIRKLAIYLETASLSAE